MSSRNQTVGYFVWFCCMWTNYKKLLRGYLGAGCSMVNLRRRPTCFLYRSPFSAPLSCYSSSTWLHSVLHNFGSDTICYFQGNWALHSPSHIVDPTCRLWVWITTWGNLPWMRILWFFEWWGSPYGDPSWWCCALCLGCPFRRSPQHGEHIFNGLAGLHTVYTVWQCSAGKHLVYTRNSCIERFRHSSHCGWYTVVCDLCTPNAARVCWSMVHSKVMVCQWGCFLMVLFLWRQLLCWKYNIKLENWLKWLQCKASWWRLAGSTGTVGSIPTNKLWPPLLVSLITRSCHDSTMEGISIAVKVIPVLKSYLRSKSPATKGGASIFFLWWFPLKWCMVYDKLEVPSQKYS